MTGESLSDQVWIVPWGNGVPRVYLCSKPVLRLPSAVTLNTLILSSVPEPDSAGLIQLDQLSANNSVQSRYKRS